MTGSGSFAGGLTNVEVALTVTDTATGIVRTYLNPQRTPFQPILDTSAFPTCAAGLVGSAVATAGARGTFDARGRPPADAGASPRATGTSAAIAERAGGCATGPTALCLDGGRFLVEASFETSKGVTGEAKAIQLTADSGYFWFFNDDNVEIVTKVLDACGVNGHHWVFAGGLTDVEVAMRVTDTTTNTVRTYTNPQRTAFRPLQDITAFAACP